MREALELLQVAKDEGSVSICMVHWKAPKMQNRRCFGFESHAKASGVVAQQEVMVDDSVSTEDCQ